MAQIAPTRPKIPPQQHTASRQRVGSHPFRGRPSEQSL
jgi:hypothetical protein